MKRSSVCLATWKIDLISLGLVATAWLLMSLSSGARGADNAPTAVDLMQQAHEGRAVWHKFPGFTAKVRASVDGETVEGTASVSKTGTVEFDLPAGIQRQMAEKTLKSVVGHRLSDDPAIQAVAFADSATTHPLGRLLKSTDSADHSLWRVQGDLLTEVHRFNEKTHFVISVSDVVRNLEQKHLPHNFTVTTWDNATNQIVSTRQVYNEWKRVGPLDLPTKLLAVTNASDGSRRAEQVELFDHQLLAPVAAVESTK